MIRRDILLDIRHFVLYNVVIMYLDISTIRVKGRAYTRALLRRSRREGKKVVKETVANVSGCSPEDLAAIGLALKHKKDLAKLLERDASLSLRQGFSIGASWTVYEVARQIGVAGALGASRQGKLALWQVIARVIAQGSRLSAVRLASGYGACEILGLDRFDEEDLYAGLDWLAEEQAVIEDRLFRATCSQGPPGLFLYDVTSAYLEGVCNELGAFGYNRDGKKGKRQIVIGLLCEERGKALSIEVFTGNTQDPATLASQVRKAAERFGGGEVTFVGDRGMIKSRQVEDLTGHGMHYISAITKPQIEGLLGRGVIQLGLFDQELAEVVTDEGVRYVLRRNPVRAEEVRATRESKLAAARRTVEQQNAYLAEHPRARVETALRTVAQRCEKLKIAKWSAPAAADRTVRIEVEDDALSELAQLDGCYVLKTDLKPEAFSKEVLHARYKDLALVEQAFRTSKTGHLEVRPVYVRKASRTRGHALVVLLAHRIVQELAERWRDLDLTVEEGLRQLATLSTCDVVAKGESKCHQVPAPREALQALLTAAGVRLPDALPPTRARVVTRKKLPPSRRPRATP